MRHYGAHAYADVSLRYGYRNSRRPSRRKVYAVRCNCKTLRLFVLLRGSQTQDTD